jgi:hypothetical protein
MGPKAEANGLERYKLGQRIRRLRRAKSMGLRDLSKHPGLSVSSLSKLERGLGVPTVATLHRIAMVFSVGVEYFFAPEPKRVLEIARRVDRLRLPNLAGTEVPEWFFENLNFRVTSPLFQSYFAEFPARIFEEGKLRTHEHEGIEFLYILSGELELIVMEEKYLLKEGDAVYFDSAAPHRYRAAGNASCTAMVIVGTREATGKPMVTRA